ncbi:cupin domain-containing protein [Bdellovibrio sp. HCB185ZH]|uniref:cupin domain-containing protein n=1 Tax=Bdellovibrio sp. HCB185ZH TaxID=3394235 RepID=UPI0039A5D8D3
MVQQSDLSSQPQQSNKNSNIVGAITALDFSETKEVREFPLGRLELLDFNGAVVGRATLQPGWKWSESVKPIAQTDSCQAPHFQYHVAGILRIKMDDGKEIECGPGEVSLIPPGHDAWVVGNEPVVLIDFQGMVDYAKQEHTHQH